MIPLHDDNPTALWPLLTVTFIAACVLVFIWQFSHADAMRQQIVLMLGFTPAALFTTYTPGTTWIPPLATLFSSMFLHGGWAHLIGNMLYLWIFGNNIEDAMGHVRFVIFYLLCGIAAAMAQAFADPESTIPMVGASGAISGVLGAYLLLYPRARVMVLIPLGLLTRVIYLPAVFVLGFWFVFQIINSLLTAGNQGGGVAWGAHIGGFLAGMVLIPLFKSKTHPLFGAGR